MIVIDQTQAWSKRVLDSGGTLKTPGSMTQAQADSITEYMSRFPHAIRVQLGRVYTEEFKEFNQDCHRYLGEKYKDWVLAGAPGVVNTEYTLYIKEPKRATFLALKYSHCVDKVFER